MVTASPCRIRENLISATPLTAAWEKQADGLQTAWRQRTADLAENYGICVGLYDGNDRSMDREKKEITIKKEKKETRRIMVIHRSRGSDRESKGRRDAGAN